MSGSDEIRKTLQKLKEASSHADPVINERFGWTGAGVGASVGALIGGGVGAGIGAIIGGAIASYFGNQVNKANEKEFIEISTTVALKLQEILNKYELDGCFTHFDRNTEGDRRFVLYIHPVNYEMWRNMYAGRPGASTGSMHISLTNYDGIPLLSFQVDIDDSLKRYLKGKIEPQFIRCFAEYSYVDTDGNHGIVRKRQYGDIDKVISFCDEFLSRHHKIFKTHIVNKQPPLRGSSPTYS